MHRVARYVGLRGVDESESSTAIKWGKYFDTILVAAVIWLVVQWYLELKGHLAPADLWLSNFMLWSFFVSETAVLALLVHDRKQYFRHNWMNVIIILSGLILLFWEIGPLVYSLRILRILLVVGIVTPWVALSFRFLSDNRLDTTIFAGFVILILAGTLIAGIEPKITTVEEGIWWAWVTLTTVGYGDIVPTTTWGRLFASLLMLVGLGFFSVITANFAALFVERNAKNNHYLDDKFNENYECLNELKDKYEGIEEHLRELNESITELNRKKK